MNLKLEVFAATFTIFAMGVATGVVSWTAIVVPFRPELSGWPEVLVRIGICTAGWAVYTGIAWLLLKKATPIARLGECDPC